jgi:curved DNA-binding protein
MADKDLYRTLGVSRNATQDEIKRAFRKLAKANHPDVNPGDLSAEERFKEVNTAFDVLGDPEKRKRYDEFGMDGLRDGFDPEQARAYQRWASQSGGTGGFRGTAGGAGFDFSGLGDLFGDLFGGGGSGFGGFGRGRQPGPRRGSDVEATVTVDFMTAVRGGELALRVDGAHSESLSVKVPPGIDDGGRLRLSGKGNPGSGQGAEPGDLILTVKVTPHPSLRREGRDLYMTVPVTVGEALLGQKITLPTPDGGTVTMGIPKRSQNGARLRLKGKGVPDLKGSGRGDLFVILDVRLPSSDDAEVDSLARSLEQHYKGEARRPTEL